MQETRLEAAVLSMAIANKSGFGDRGGACYHYYVLLIAVNINSVASAMWKMIAARMNMMMMMMTMAMMISIVMTMTMTTTVP